jgi:hypothetical protein
VVSRYRFLRVGRGSARAALLEGSVAISSEIAPPETRLTSLALLTIARGLFLAACWPTRTYSSVFALGVAIASVCAVPQLDALGHAQQEVIVEPPSLRRVAAPISTPSIRSARRCAFAPLLA